MTDKLSELETRLAAAKASFTYWASMVEDLAGAQLELDAKMAKANEAMDSAWELYEELLKAINKAEEDEIAVCDRCGEPFGAAGSYETADGEYVCLDCHTSDIDGAEYMMEDR